MFQSACRFRQINRQVVTRMSSNKRSGAVEMDDRLPKRPKAISLLPFESTNFLSARARLLTRQTSLNKEGRYVIYWMSRDQRAVDNHALHYAQVG